MSDVLAEEAQAGWFRGIVSELCVSGLPLNTHSNALENLRLVKAGPGLLFGFSCSSSLATAQFIQLFDSHDAPASGAVPAAVFQINGAAVATGNDLSVSYIFPGRFFQAGIWIGNSTTRATYTAGAANCFFDVQFA